MQGIVLKESKSTVPVALVAVEKALYSFDRLYSYIIPYELEPTVQVGKRVLVPFGRGTKKITGMVFGLSTSEKANDGSLKKISEVLDEEAFMNREMLELAAWLKENTFCTYYNAVRCILPPVLRVRGAFPKEKTQKIVMLRDDAQLPETLTPKQRSVIEVLENNSASIKEVCYLCSVTSAVVTNLVKKEILVLNETPTLTEEEEAVVERNVDEIILNQSQDEVFEALLTLMQADEPKCSLLHGITGSGKTSVFIKLVGEALKRDKSAMILVPEISLTPQTIAIFKGFFGDNAAVIHSGLTMSKRTNEYKRIRDGEARIVIGTRSAVFAPLSDIGLIVIDEEGEQTYKSDRSPRYHVRDIAKQRCFKHGSLLLLASATPSMDSYRKAQVGKYTLLELNERYCGNELPDVRIIDMRLEREMGNASNFSEELLSKLQENLHKGEQSLILLNRRGERTFISCIACGEVEICPHCNIAMTLHKQGALRCHYCNYSRQYSYKCNECGSQFVRQTGSGTQRVEDELQELFPSARILRMDADTTMTKGAYERGFGSFGNHEYDIMVGTQMVAKGLDFPNVTLVGILLIDNSLYAGDYLGYERTFSLITQVVGRCGRGDKKGFAFLQTFTPEHYVLRLAAQQDYRGFYEEEATIRQTLLFPPFCDLCIIEVNSVMEESALKSALEFTEIIENELRKTENKLPIRVLGPVKNGVGNIGGRFRYRLIIKCRNSPVLRNVISEALKASSKRMINVSAWFE
jgi:primosomal protein N' (replication factor Y)